MSGLVASQGTEWTDRHRTFSNNAIYGITHFTTCSPDDICKEISPRGERYISALPIRPTNPHKKTETCPKVSQFNFPQVFLGANSFRTRYTVQGQVPFRKTQKNHNNLIGWSFACKFVFYNLFFSLIVFHFVNLRSHRQNHKGHAAYELLIFVKPFNYHRSIHSLGIAALNFKLLS